MPQRSAHTSAPSRARFKRILVIATAAVAGGAFVAVAQQADATTNRFGFGNRNRQPACAPTAPGRAATGGNANAQPRVSVQNGRQVRQWPGDEGNPNTRFRRRGDRCTPPGGGGTGGGAGNNNGGGNNGGGAGNNGGGNNGGGGNGSASPSASPPAAPPALVDVGPGNCDGSNLKIHDGFQAESTCVNTVLGEVGTLDNSPTALIVSAPQQLTVGQAFTIRVSTRNIIRDRFLAAAAGGYYLEAARLKNGLAEGHAHLGCEIIAAPGQTPDEAPISTRTAPLFFAIEDGGGGAGASEIDVNLPGPTAAGTLRCALWLGSQSHAIPALPFANQIPGFDTARINVVEAGGGNAGGGNAGGGNAGGGAQAGGGNANQRNNQGGNNR